MNCLKYQENLSDYLHEEPLEASMHRRDCTDCAEEFKKAKAVVLLFSQLPQYEPRPWTVNKIIAYSRAHQDTPQGFRSVVSQGLAWLKSGGWNWAPVAVTLFMATSFVFLAEGRKPFTDSNSILASSDVGLQEDLGGARPDFRLGNQPPSVAVRNVAVGDLDPSWQKNYQMEIEADQLLMRGRRFKAMGRVDLALHDFDALFKNYPNYTYIGDVLMYRAQCYALQGHFDEAIESLKVYQQKFPSKKSLVEPTIQQLEQSKSLVKE